MAKEVELTDKLKKGTKLTPELVNIIKQFWHNQVFGAHDRQIVTQGYLHIRRNF